MKIRIPLMTLCALSALACDDAVAPNDIDLGPSRDVGVLGPGDMTASPRDTGGPAADEGIPVLEPEPDPGEPEPDPDPDPEPMEPEPTGPCAPGETRLCVESCGVAACVDGQFGPCQAASELCNGHDDNCNGTPDEGYAGLGVGCVVDQNGCSSQGTRVCAADQRSVICDAPPVMPQNEVCDGDDDDCDGNVDEDFPGRVCCVDDLQCGPGETCEGGECTGGVGPGPNPPGQCTTDFDCFFQFCVQGVCRDPCLDAIECAPGEACVQNACVPGAGPECVADGDCFGFETCENGVCVPPMAPPCLADAECPGDETCQDGVCALPPGGSSCDAPVVMDGFGVYPGSNVAAFDAIDGGCGRADDGPEQVFEFTLEVNARVTLDTDGSNFDTVLSVRSPCAAGAEELACDDDGGGEQFTSAVTFDALAGTTYFAVVEGYGAEDTGQIVLNFAGVEICVADADCPEGLACDDGACVVPPCAADADCPGDEVCRAGVCEPPPPPLCDGGIEMDAFGVYLGSTVGAPDRVDGSCRGAAAGSEQVFTFTLDEPAEVVLDTGGADFDTVMSVWTDCNDRDLFCDDDGGSGTASRIVFDAEAGVRYYVVVESYSAGITGDVPLRFVSPGQGCGDGCEGVCANLTCVPPTPDACLDVTPADLVPGAWVGDTSGLPDQHAADCGGGGSPDAVLLVGFPDDVRVTASTVGSDYDTVLYALEECGAEVACNDDIGFLDRDSEISFQARAGVGYYIVVDGFNGASGPFQLTVEAD